MVPGIFRSLVGLQGLEATMKMLQAHHGNTRPDAAVAEPVLSADLILACRLTRAILSLDGNLLLRCP